MSAPITWRHSGKWSSSVNLFFLESFTWTDSLCCFFFCLFFTTPFVFIDTFVFRWTGRTWLSAMLHETTKLLLHTTSKIKKVSLKKSFENRKKRGVGVFSKSAVWWQIVMQQGRAQARIMSKRMMYLFVVLWEAVGWLRGGWLKPLARRLGAQPSSFGVVSSRTDPLDDALCGPPVEKVTMWAKMDAFHTGNLFWRWREVCEMEGEWSCEACTVKHTKHPPARIANTQPRRNYNSELLVLFAFCFFRVSMRTLR